MSGDSWAVAVAGAEPTHPLRSIRFCNGWTLSSFEIMLWRLACLRLSHFLKIMCSMVQLSKMILSDVLVISRGEVDLARWSSHVGVRVIFSLGSHARANTYTQ